jgi:hypothetical protein
MFYTGLQACTTHDNHIVHCMLQFYTLSKLTGSMTSDSCRGE